MIEEDLTKLDLADVRLRVNALEKDFNKTRELLYHRVRHFFHQSIGSDYISMTEIRSLLDRCEELKTEYKEFRDAVLEAHKNEPPRSFNGFNF